VSFENRYSFTDRLLHRIAFATPRMQIDFAEMEDERFAKAFGAVEAARPVFITAMPRAGTTLLLNLCAELDAFATHTYRDMPFVLTPYMWRQASAGFRRDDAPRERAHGDGMLVSVNSPEAFEEMLWKAFWPDQYKDDRILVWPSEGGEDFQEFFRRHMAKLAKINQAEGAPLPRYASKNNLNIARIAWLRHAFPDAAVIVPFRKPIQHAASLLRQHLNFLELHRTDAFMRAYMAGIGHFDFGANLRPIDFEGWLDAAPGPATELSFWIAYWTAAYGYCLRRCADDIVLIDYDDLCARPAPALRRLAEAVSVEPDAFEAQASGVRAPRDHEAALAGVDPALVAEAESLHAALQEAARCESGQAHERGQA
jgi:hypothetical protein